MWPYHLGLCFALMVFLLYPLLDAGNTHHEGECSHHKNTSTGNNTKNVSSTELLPMDWSSVPESRKTAEGLWTDQQGFLWMQHARKAGGTTLCMTLRYNAMGLVVHERTKLPSSRETCQLLPFCHDCDIKTEYPQPELHDATVTALLNYSRNFIEFEANGVPVDMLEEQWNDFVFVSTIRHPLERIMSSLKGDPDFYCKTVFNTGCMKKYITQEAIRQRCDSEQEKGIYHCHSNYYVRMFSGMDKNWTTKDDMMQRAKTNFQRFSCVILQERWDETSHCLRHLGLYRTPGKRFNVAGNVRGAGIAAAKQQQIGNATTFSLLPKQEQDNLLHLNELDLEFYEWARNLIMSTSLFSDP